MRAVLLEPLVGVALLACGVSAMGCKRDPAPSATAAVASTSASVAPSAPSTPQGTDLTDTTSPMVLAPARRLRWAEPPEATTDVAKVVREARAREAADGRTLLVYVGATWCEPCQRFHHAVERGDLDDALPSLTVLAFDVDRDGEALATAGYVSRLIPLFALPAASGRDSGKRIEGSVKGEEAVGEITPRLRALLAGAAPP